MYAYLYIVLFIIIFMPLTPVSYTPVHKHANRLFCIAQKDNRQYVPYCIKVDSLLCSGLFWKKLLPRDAIPSKALDLFPSLHLMT